MAELSLQTKKLEGKVAIISGGARGIGEATARFFSIHGARIVIADVLDEEGHRVAESIGSSICTYIHCDVADEQQVQSIVESTLKTHGQLDIMFSNAGIFSKSSQDVLDLDISELNNLFSINVAGMAACVKHAGRAMVEKGIKGSIICTASVAATGGADHWTDYHMSKHAVLGLMRSASKQLGQHGIRVNSVAPYAVATPFTFNTLQMSVEEIEEMNKDIYLKGMVLKVTHVADAVLFLSSNDSECITGHNLAIDGGMTSNK